jgi:hypothetical protein
MLVGNASPASHKGREKNKKKVPSINQPSINVATWGGVWFLQERQKDGTRRTFGDFDSFNRLVVYDTGTLFNELIAFNTEIEDVRALHE